MLASLNIQNVVLIDRLNITFENGLCALTGETGAGKSILLDSLGLALGSRAESRLVRKGADQAQVIAEFEIPTSHPYLNILHNANLETDDEGTLILRRVLTVDGRSKAYINDQPVSIGLLKEVGESLVEIHGQFETHGLMNASTHRGYLDDYAQIDTNIEQLWGAWQDAVQALKTLQEEAETSRRDEDYLRQAVEDLDSLDPQSGEEEHLASLRDRLMHRERVLEGLNAAYAALNTEDDPVRKAWGALDRIADKLGDGAQEVIGPLDRASAEIQEAMAAIQSFSADLQESEHNLETIDDRLYELRTQARKHNCTVDELPEMRDELAKRLNQIDHADEALAAQMKAVEEARNGYIQEARRVHEQRKKAGAKLDKLVQKELVPLKLEKARFVTQIDELPDDEWGPSGMDQVRFLVATNPGSEPGPIHKIASGGEIARFMLALKVVLAKVGAAQSLIFDEVDTGIGGSTADAVGERLARLAQDKQVLVVTHSPQVAARANHHWIVRKDGSKALKTNVVPLNDNTQRREEIARMLAGATITEEARAAAEKLLETG